MRFAFNPYHDTPHHETIAPMTTDDEDYEEEHQSLGLYAIFRKVMFALAGIFILWTYAMQNFRPPHTSPTTDNAIDEKPAGYSPPAYAVGRSINTTATAAVATPTASETTAPSTPATTVSTQSSAVATPIATPATVVDHEHIAHLENQLQEQEKSLNALKAEITELRAAKDQLQASTEQSNRRLTIITAMGLFIEAVHHGEPFTAQLNQLYASLPSDAANHDKVQALLDSLKPRAEKGIPTYEQLLAQFNERIPLALAPNENAPLWQKSMQSLVRIRKVGEQQGTDDEAVLARAEAKLNRHDISGAVTELQALSKPAETIMDPWLSDANALLNSTKAINELQIAFTSAPNA